MSAHDNTIETAVTRMAYIGTCRCPAFSPDGEWLAFVSDMSGTPQLWKVSAKGGWPTQVTALEDQVTGVVWSPDGEWLAFNLAPGGGMNQQVYLIRPDGSGLRRLTDGGADNNWLRFWSRDSRTVSIISNRHSPHAMDCYLYHIDSGEWQLIARNDGIGSLTDISRDGRYALVYRVANRGDSNLYLIDLVAQTETLLTPHAGPGTFEAGKFSNDGKTIYLIGDDKREMAAFASIQLDADGKVGSLTLLHGRDDAVLQEFVLSEDGTTAALVWNVAGRCELAFVDLEGGQMSAGAALPAEVIEGLQFSADGRLLTFDANGAAAPHDVWVYDREVQQMWQVTQSQHPGIQLDRLIKPDLVRFKGHDGLELSGWLYIPHQFKAPGALVLSFHGGPEGQERPVFRSDYQALLAEGIAILAPNVRGSSGFGKTFVNLDNGALRVDAIRDIKACADYVIERGICASDRLGIMGGSYGGYMTMAGLSEYPDLFAAGANLFGVVNFRTFFANTEPWMAAISKVEYGDPDTQGDLLDSLSPIFKIEQVQAPTIVLHGANDTNVPVVEAEQVVNALKARNIAVDYVLFADEGHGFLKTVNRIASTIAIVRWFSRYLVRRQGSGS